MHTRILLNLNNKNKHNNSFLLTKQSVYWITDMESIITIEPGKRGGKPCIRGMRITVYDILNWLASGMSYMDIMNDYPELTREDILAAIKYAALREQKTSTG